MSAEIKFCGLMRSQDAVLAAELGAAYTGVIFAGGPRNLTVERAVEVLAPVRSNVRRVGVFADQPASEIVRIAERCMLGVVQLHGDFSPERIAAIRRDFGGEIWSVCHVDDSGLPPMVDEMLDAGDGLLLDAKVAGRLGGTGVTIPWTELSSEVQRIRGAKRIVLAGGLRPENVAEAISILDPDVVDVSSGVESAPGTKDPVRMRAFRDAVNQISSIP